MKILALELSSGRGSIAFLDENEIRFTREFPNDRKHSGLFFENLQECVQSFGNPERIVAGLGPGSYAGTRIAIAAALGLQAVASAELIGISSVCALPTEETEYAVIGDARRQSFWFARVRGRLCVEEPALHTTIELNSRLTGIALPIFTSEALPAFPEAILSHSSALVLARIAMGESESFVRPPLEPIYLREPHITRPKAA